MNSKILSQVSHKQKSSAASFHAFKKTIMSEQLQQVFHLFELIKLTYVYVTLLCLYHTVPLAVGTTNLCFWLVNIPLWEFDTSSKKTWKWKKKTLWWKATKKIPKKYIKVLSNIFYELAPLIRDVICSKL